MTAKANIIRELRAQNRNLQEKVEAQKKDALHKERRLSNLKHNFDDHLLRVRYAADNIRELFSKDFTWNKLSNDSNKQIVSLGFTLERINDITSDAERLYTQHRKTVRS